MTELDALEYIKKNMDVYDEILTNKDTLRVQTLSIEAETEVEEDVGIPEEKEDVEIDNEY